MKLKSIFFTLFSLVWILPLMSQTFDISVNSRQVNEGKVIKVDFTIKNMQGDFEEPDFSPFQVVSGPNQMQSMQMINGEFSSETTYTYYLQAPQVGNYFIPPATFISEEGIFETESVEILVLAEDDTIQPEVEGKNENNALQQLLKKKKVKKL